MIYTPYIWPQLLAAGLLAGMALAVHRYRETPGVRPFIWMMWLGAVWTFIYTLNISTAALPLKLWWYQLQYIPSLFVAPACLILALEYIGQSQWLTRPRLAWILAMPCITMLLVAATPFQTLLRYDFRVDNSGPFPVMLSAFGPVYWLDTFYNLALFLIGCGLLLVAGSRQQVHLRNAVVLVVGFLLPLLANTLYQFKLTPIPGYDWSHIVSALTGVLYIWALLRFQLFSMVPVARNAVMDAIDDWVIVLDRHDHIVDFNRAAQAAGGLTPACIGTLPGATSTAGASWLQPYLALMSGRAQVTLPQEDQDQHFYDLSVSPVQDARGRPLGRLFLMHDITERKHAEDEVNRLNATLEQRVAERTEALRASEESFRTLAENAQDAIVIVNREHQILFANRRLSEFLDWPPAALSQIPFKDIFPPDVQALAVERLAQRLRGEEVPAQYELRFQRRDRQVIPVELAVARTNWHGQPAALAFARDISERHQRMAEIAQRNYELETLTDLSAAMRQVDTLLDLAHLVVQRSCEVLKMEAGALAFLSGDRLTFAAGEGTTPDLLNRTFAVGDDRLGWALRSPNAVFVSDQTSLAPDQPPWPPDFPQRPGLRAYALIPLKSAQAQIGLLALFSQTAQEFTPLVRRLIVAMADMAGNALQRIRTTEMLEQLVADRTRELSALYQVTALTNQASEWAQRLEDMLRATLEAAGCPLGFIYLLENDPPSPHLAASLKTVSRSDSDRLLPASAALALEVLTQNKAVLKTVSGRAPTGALLGVPISVSGRPLGVLCAYHEQTGPLTLELIALLTSISERIGIGVENYNLQAQSRQLAVLEERQRLARDLHDSVSQQIYGLLMFAGSAKDAAQEGQSELALLHIRRIEEIARQAQRELRLLIHQLRPLALQKEGLIAALRYRLASVERRVGLNARLTAPDHLALSAKTEENLYHIVIEALNNSLKHAQATEVGVSLQTVEGSLALAIADNGKGFDPENLRAGGSGLVNMRERARQVGGVLEVRSAPGQGTHIDLHLETSHE